MVVDNSWISVLAISILLKQSNKPINGEVAVNIVAAWVGFGVFAWTTRYIASRHLVPSSIASWIAPKMSEP